MCANKEKVMRLPTLHIAKQQQVPYHFYSKIRGTGLIRQGPNLEVHTQQCYIGKHTDYKYYVDDSITQRHVGIVKVCIQAFYIPKGV